MRRTTSVQVLAGLALASFGMAVSAQGQPPQQPQPAPQYSAVLNVGDRAPGFKLPGSDGKVHSLSDYKGKTVVLAWFPKAFTGGWTAECKSLRESGQVLKTYDIAYFMVSVDTLEDNTRFAKEHEADFPILADPAKETAKAYGVIRTDLPPERQLAARWTYYIGPDGRILAIDKSPTTATAGDVMVKKLDELGVKKKQ
jgi:thioredoxin-dependent peroxiredoxin